MNGSKGLILSISEVLVAKESNMEAGAWWYGLELSTKPLLDHSKSMKELNWIALSIMIIWPGLSFHGASLSLSVKCVFMYDNALSRVSKLTCEFFEHKRFTGEKIMEWLTLSPDQNHTVSCEDKVIWRWQTI